MQKLIFLCFLFSATIGRSQFLLDNPDFDSNLSNWTIPSSPPAQWNSFDMNSSVFSGSAFVINSETNADSDVEVLKQCISNFPPGNLKISLTGYIPSGQKTSGSLIMRYYRYQSGDCSTANNGQGGYYVVQSDTTEIWQGNIDDVPWYDGYNSILFVIAIRKTEAGGTFSAYVDGAILENVDHIFSHGFE